MCNRWQKEINKEISLDKIQDVFSSRLFSKVEDVNLHGGEPTLRNDLADICRVIQDSCPKLERIWISTNGFGPRRIEKRIKEILNVLNFHKLDFLEINVSVDGIEETHDKIRGVKGGFRQCLSTIRILKNLTKNEPVKVSIGTVIQPLNIMQIDEIKKLAQDLEVPIMFQPLMFDEFFNLTDNSDLVFNEKSKKILKGLIEKKFTNEITSTSFYWHDYVSMMDGERRKSPCAFDRYVFSLYPTGEVLPCSQKKWIMFGNVYDNHVDEIWFSEKAKEVRKRMKKEVCPTCSAYCGVEFSLQKEFFIYLRFYFKKKIHDLSRRCQKKS
jgi:MoaA/NifB/PqqE/SkfB family radical SAM enzyme